MPNPTPFKDLAGYMDKQVIACVEGVITKIQDKIARGTGQYGDWAMQFSTLKDDAGTFHDLVITDENSFLQNGVQGMRFRAEAQPQSKGGPAGVSMGVRFKDNKENRSIKVDNRAKITLLGSSPSQGAPTQERAVSVHSGGSQANLDQSPVRERVHCYFEVLKEVSSQYKHLQATAEQDGIKIPALTGSDIKDITTHLSMTYRGEFGSYAKPIFQKPQQEKVKPEVEDDLNYGSPSEDSEEIPF